LTLPTPETELYDMKSDPDETRNLADEMPDVVDDLELRMVRWLRKKLGKRIDPLELIVSHGLPSKIWVERAAKRQGMADRYEEWRAKIDRADTYR